MPKLIAKKSPRRSRAQLDQNLWREPERQSLEEVAAQWETSASFVEECVRTLKFKHIILVSPSGKGLPITDHLIFDKHYWPFKGLTANRVGLRPPVFVHLCKPSDFPCGFVWGANIKMFIPIKEVRRMKTEQSATPPNQPTISTEGHAPWLLAALDISTELYKNGKLSAQHGHKDQILKLLVKRYGGQEWLSSQMKEHIVSLVNKNKIGGSPRLSK